MNAKTHHLDSLLENRILKGLAMEWTAARDDLSVEEIKRMTCPIFTLKHGKKNLAHWDPVKREIAFSRTFVKQHSWDDIRDVLWHEMAHQYAHEVLKSGHETAHGPGFLKACERLRANPKASGSYPTLSERLTINKLSKHDKLMEKIQKLLALGQSSNPHEAQSALSKARQLIETVNLNEYDDTADPGYISCFVGKPTLRRFKEEYLIARLLVDHYHVYGIWVSTYVLAKEKMGRVFEITGRAQNVKTAAYVYDYIINQTNMAWDRVNETNTLGRYKKSDFACGLIQGFSTKLEHEKTNDPLCDNGQRALVCSGESDPALMAHAAYKYPRIRRISRADRTGDNKLRKKGEHIGKNLSLNQGIDQSDASSIKALIYTKR